MSVSLEFTCCHNSSVMFDSDILTMAEGISLYQTEYRWHIIHAGH